MVWTGRLTSLLVCYQNFESSAVIRGNEDHHGGAGSNTE